MKLKNYRVLKYKNIHDSGILDVDDHITCLVGKNESGKTALLEALCKTNPADATVTRFNYQADYPKREIRSPYYEGAVVECHYELEDTDIQQVKKMLGEGALTGKHFSVKIYYNNSKEFVPDDMKANTQIVINILIGKTKLSADQKEKLKSAEDWNKFVATINEINNTNNTPETQELATQINGYSHLGDPLMQYILNVIIQPLIPRFFYLDDYPQLKGSENINALVSRGRSDPREPDTILISLFEMAELNYLEMNKVNDTNSLENIYGDEEGLGDANRLATEEIFKYWHQNEHLQIKFSPKIAALGDPEGMTSGVNMWIKIRDTEKKESTPLSQRSKGFIWFFSLLVQYAAIKRAHNNVILLLDEPGLHLHGKAQNDLLKCFDEEFSDTQILYTTHSPFMVDVSRFDRIRVVHDTGSKGAKVSNDALSIKSDSLLPLQAALGYGATQSLFISPNCLIVEGVSDMLFLKAVSSKLIENKRTGLSHKWTIIPVGGIGKAYTFVSIIKSQEDVNAIALLDAQKQQQQAIDNLRKHPKLDEKHVLTYAAFLGDDCKEADVEDLFERSFYLNLVNEACKDDLPSPIEMSDINSNIPRIVASIGNYLKKNPLQDGETNYDHYKPARYFHQNIDTLWGKLPDPTKDKFEKMFKQLNQLLK